MTMYQSDEVYGLCVSLSAGRVRIAQIGVTQIADVCVRSRGYDPQINSFLWRPRIAHFYYKQESDLCINIISPAAVYTVFLCQLLISATDRTLLHLLIPTHYNLIVQSPLDLPKLCYLRTDLNIPPDFVLNKTGPYTILSNLDLKDNQIVQCMVSLKLETHTIFVVRFPLDLPSTTQCKGLPECIQFESVWVWPLIISQGKLYKKIVYKLYSVQPALGSLYM